MKLQRFSFLVIGLVSFAALARSAEAQSNLPATGAAVMAAPDLKPAEAPDRKQLSLAFGNYLARVDTNYLGRIGVDQKTDLDLAKLVEGFSNFMSGNAPNREQLSVAFGNDLGRVDTNYLARTFTMDAKSDLDVPKLVEGFSNFLAGPITAMPDQEMTNILHQQVSYLEAKVKKETKALVDAGPENKANGIKFLDENAKAPAVTRLTNGVEYKVVKDGDGVLPGSGDAVTLRISVQRIDGTEVMKVHYEFAMTNMTPPLPAIMSQMLGMMKAGSHWIIYLPYDLAFGDQPTMGDLLHTPKLAPYSAMIFDTELEGVRPMPALQPAVPGGPVPNRGAAVRPSPPPTSSLPVSATSSDIVRVPSAEELKRGSNIEFMTLDEAMKRSQTNAPASR
ncbi:MAG: FKBP-type peptidyl-prolyl cis-trans isomerase N-terminal domain-containing protein [Verrucomicrobiota bacterium]|jgi:FKBP-type peptidyl-prolyl cis-trans isomerase FklB